MRGKLWTLVVAAVVSSVVGNSPGVRAANKSIVSGGTRTGVVADNDNWYFTGQAGDLILIKAVDNNYVATVKTMGLEVYEAGVGWLGSHPCGSGMYEFRVPENVPPDSPGTVRNFYFRAQTGSCDAGYTGPYDVSLLNITRGPLGDLYDSDGGYLGNAFPETGSIPSGGLSDMDAYFLPAGPGDEVRVSVSVAAQPPYDGPSPLIILYDPQKNAVAGVCGDQLDYVVPPADAPEAFYTVVFQDCNYPHGTAPWDGAYDVMAYFNIFRGQFDSGETRRDTIASGTSSKSWELKDIDLQGGQPVVEFQAGDRVIVQAYTENTAAPMRLRLHDKYGTILAESNSCTSRSILDVVLPAHEGSLFLKASNTCNPNQYDYFNLSVLNLTRGPLTTAAEDEGGALILPVPSSGHDYLLEYGTIGITDMDAYTFNGMPGDRVTIGAPGVRISLYPPGGGAPVSACDLIPNYVLADSGKHTIVLDACAPGTTGYTLDVNHVSYMTAMGPIVSGETVQGAIDSAMWHAWEFTAGDGDEVIFASALLGSTYAMEIVTTDLYGNPYPPGSFPCPANPATNPGSRSFRAWSPGTYTMAVRSCEPQYAGTHDYSLTLLNTSAATFTSAFDPANPERHAADDPDGGAMLPGQTVDPLSPFAPPHYPAQALHPGDLDAYQFHGEPGDRVIIKAWSGSPGTVPRIGLYRPRDYPGYPPEYGTRIDLGACGSQEVRHELELDHAGLHTLVLEDCAYTVPGDAGNYFFTVEKLPGTYAFWDPAAVAGPYLDVDGGNVGANTGGVGQTGGSVTAAIDLPTDMDVYYFYTTGNETVHVELPPPPTFNAQLSVHPLIVSPPLKYAAPLLTVCNSDYPASFNISLDLPLAGAGPGFYAIVVESCAGLPNLTGSYTLTVDPATDEKPVREPRPENGASVANAFDPAYLSWEPAWDSSGYFVEFGASDGPLVPLNTTVIPQWDHTGTCTTCHGPEPVTREQYSVSHPLPYAQMQPGTTYSWRVLSSHSSGRVVASPVWQFTFADCDPSPAVSFPATLDFGPVLANSTVTLPVTITNSGTCYQMPTPSAATPDPPFRIVAADCPAGPAGGVALAPGDSCTLDVEFKPTGVQIASGGITLSGFLPGTFPAQTYPPPYVPTINLSGESFTLDLRVSDLSIPAAVPGSGVFGVTETTVNTGSAPAAASTTRYYFSANAVFDPGDEYADERSVPALGPGASSAATETVPVPLGLVSGDYYLIACADHGGAAGQESQIAESDEANNCRASATPLALPDLRPVAASFTRTPDGGSFVVTDTTRSDGAAAGATVTRYFLSVDQSIAIGDWQWSSRNVPALSAGAADTPGAPAALLVPDFVPNGSYYVGACVDVTGSVWESSETNNCLLASGPAPIVVSRDLLLQEVFDPAQPDDSGQFSFTDSVRNIGTVSVANIDVHYRLSLDQRITRLDPVFAVSRTIPLLTPSPDPGHGSQGTVTLTVPPGTPRGFYYVAACVDDADAFVESDESNNCMFSKTTIRVEPDLEIVAFSVASGTAAFEVTDSTHNKGLTAAESSTLRFRLSQDSTITPTDYLLSGTRAVSALDIGAISTGTTTLTVPAAVPRGPGLLYYVGACADDLGAVVEKDETNNCVVQMTQVELDQADLMVVSLSNPPASAHVGQSLNLNDTTRNDATSPFSAAEGSSTSFRLSLNATYETGDPQIGTRSVPALPAGGESAAVTKATVPANLAAGTYYLLVCADSAGAVPESDEADNCRASATTMEVGVPDLTVTALANPPDSAVAGTGFSVLETTRNASATTKAIVSNTRYRLTADTVVTATDPLLAGSRSVPALSPSTSSSGGAAVTIPATVPAGTYFLAACADDANAISESSETNNCRVNTAQALTVSVPVSLQPDLVAAISLNTLPASGPPGANITLGVTVTNPGLGASTTEAALEVRLTTDDVINGSDPKPWGSCTLLDPVAAGGNGYASCYAKINHEGKYIPEGTYHVGVCVDSGNAVTESNETNNCFVDTTREVVVILPDWTVTAISDPPIDAVPGDAFAVTDTAVNVGSTAAQWTTMTYRLSEDGTITQADTLLTGSRTVGAFVGVTAPNDPKTGTVTVTIPATLAQGTYYLAACLDDMKLVLESDETNNCLVNSASPIDIVIPDLVIAAIGDPPATGNPGDPLPNIGVTTRNIGVSRAKASTTRFHLTLDTHITAADPLLTGSVAVPVLAAGAQDSATLALTIPASVPGGTYYLAACADGASVVKESVETNNCSMSAGRITVSQPDLVISGPPAAQPPTTVAGAGTQFAVTDDRGGTTGLEVTNGGSAPAGASVIRFRFSTDTTITSADPQLTGSKAVAPLAAGATDASPGPVTVTVPASMPAGTYYLAACADGDGAVAESNEANNCSVNTASPIEVRKPDLLVSALSEPPAGPLPAGSSFTVSDTTTNNGSDVGTTTLTRYRLSADATVGGSDPLLIINPALRVVPALAAGTSDAGPGVSVTIPTNNVFAGYYYLAACADHANAIPESDEDNNCTLSQNQVYVENTDLVVDAVDAPVELSVNAGGTLTVGARIRNAGASAAFNNAGAEPISTRFRLSTDRTISASDPLLTGGISTAPGDTIAAGDSRPTSGFDTATVTVPATVTEGEYFLGACVDEGRIIAESNEANNCLVYDDGFTRIQVRKPDLTSFAVGAIECTSPAADAWAGMTLRVTDGVVNYGSAPVGIETDVSYRLSRDGYITSTDPLLVGARPVPPLPAFDPAGCPGCSEDVGIDFPVTIGATVPPGVYYLAACADGSGEISESSEDNCYKTPLPCVEVKQADLRVGVVIAPSSVTRSVNFTVTDQTYNGGAVPAGFTTKVRYYLSTDATITAADTRLTNGTRTVPVLLATGDPGGGDVSMAPVTNVQVPATVTPGTYYLGACADDLNTVPETDEENNCIATAATVTVQ